MHHMSICHIYILINIKTLGEEVAEISRSSPLLFFFQAGIIIPGKIYD